MYFKKKYNNNKFFFEIIFKEITTIYTWYTLKQIGSNNARI